MNRLIIITTSNIMLTKPAPDGEDLLPLLQKLVDGWIEAVHPRGLSYPYVMICNEEGLLRGLPFNAAGSWLYGYQQHHNPIKGTVVLMKEVSCADGDMDIAGIPEDEATYLMEELLQAMPGLKCPEFEGEEDANHAKTSDDRAATT